MATSVLRKVGLVAGGVLMGLFGLAFGLWFYLQAARVDEARTAIGENVQIARDAIEDVEFIEDDALRITLRDLVLYSEDGDTIVSAPRALMTLDALSLNEEGPIEFFDVELIEPVADLIQRPNGEWNLFEPMLLAAAGEPVQTEQGRPLAFRDVRIRNGNLVVAMPTEPPAEDAALAMNIPRVRIGGLPYQRYTLLNVDAELPLFRVGGTDGWRAEISDLDADVVEPELRISELRAVFEQVGEDGFEFDLELLQFGNSQLAGEGLVRFPDTGPQYDLEIRAAPLRLADLQGLIPTLPPEGTATFALDVESLGPERLALDFSGLDVDALDSQINGRIAVAVGGGLPLSLLDAAIELAPLDFAALEQLGMAENLPLLGQVTGTVSTAGAAPGSADVNLTATMREAGQPEAPISTIFASGPVSLGSADSPTRLDGLEVSLRPLYLHSLSGFAPESAEQLRGELSGSVTLAGTTSAVELAGGDLSYVIGEAPPTRLTNLSGTVSTDPALNYRLSATASPLELATVQELYPGLPFRATTLSGPITLTGTTETIEVDADFSGPSGGLAFGGVVQLGDPMTLDIEGSIRAFSAGMLLRPDVPVEGPLTGTFAVNGSMQNLRFNVDLAQGDGSFVLAGSLSTEGATPLFGVSGNVQDFRIGSLLGEPGLFPDPMSGTINVDGGAGDPYIFDLDLTGESSRLDLSGVFQSGDVPVYNVEGFVAGVDLSVLPVPLPLPTTALTGNVDIEGRGLTLDDLSGNYAFNFGESTVSGLSLDEAVGRVDISNGIAYIDTIQVRLEDNFLAAGGSWGLRTPAPEPLRFTLRAPELGSLARVAAPGQLVPPQISGSLDAQGSIGGSIENPVVVATMSGSDLIYQGWRAQSLELDVDGRRDDVVGWFGDLTLVGDEVEIPQFDHLESLRTEISGNQQSLALGIYARRDTESDIALSGILDLNGMTPRGIGLETMALRLDGAEWELANPAQFSYVGDEGLIIEDLNLVRQGDQSGRVSVDGMIPPTGNADFRLEVENVDLADFRRVSNRLPQLEGILSLTAILDGPVNAPTMAIDGDLRDFGVDGVVGDLFTFDFDFADGNLVGAASVQAGGREVVTADLNVPMLLSMENQMVPGVELLRDGPLSSTIRADQVPLELIASLVPALSDGVGLANAQIDIGGTIDAPALSGFARVQGGALTVVPTGTRYTGIAADIDFGQSRATINQLSLTNRGTMNASGEIAFLAGSPPQLQLDANFNNFLVINDPEVAELVASGQLAVRGPTSGAVVTGSIRIDDSAVQVPELMQAEPELELAYAEFGQFGGSVPEGADVVASAPLLGDLRVDGLELTFGESVWLESDEMRVQIAGSLVVYQNAEDLRVFGALQTERGTYSLAISGIVRQFDVLRGRVQFFGTGDLNPALDIVAGYQPPGAATGRGGDVTVLVNISGTMLSPRLQLTADTPIPLSEADLISYLIFGRQNFELAGVTDAFAEQILVQEVLGGLIASELERPILQAGLCDYVSVRPGSTTASDRSIFSGSRLIGAVIECGSEIVPSVYLTVEAGLGGLLGDQFNEGGVGAEWQIDDQWTLEASFGILERDPIFQSLDDRIRTQFSTDLIRRWEYGRPSGNAGIDLTPDTETQPVPGTPDTALPSTSIQIGGRSDTPQTQEPPPIDGDGSPEPEPQQ